MKKQTLLNYLGNHVRQLDQYLLKYNWIEKDDAIYPSPIEDVSILNKDNLDFINNMTVYLENITKTNKLIIN